MKDSEPDTKAVFLAAVDRGDSTAGMEPLVLSAGSSFRRELADKVVDLAAASAGLRQSLPEGVVSALAELVRAMNCYYSNLIEGHNTHPVDIERALKNELSADTGKRNLQLEAKAHIAVQRWIDGGALNGRATTAKTVYEIHRRFCEQLPAELLRIANPETGEEIEVVPGEPRQRDVKVGRHVPVSPGAIPRFLQRFETVYGGLGKSEAILSAAATHHRLLWIHPFLDGNGRVARLMSHAILLETLDTGAIWSVARGLARSETTYKDHLAHCDLSRRNDLDGRGPLSEEALATFTGFFLDTCLDQIRFMQRLVQPNFLRERIQRWVGEEVRAQEFLPQSDKVVDAVLFRGELPRSDVPELIGTGSRQARRVVSALMKKGVLVADSSRAPLHLAFPATLASRWMPGLFPDNIA